MYLLQRHKRQINEFARKVLRGDALHHCEVAERYSVDGNDTLNNIKCIGQWTDLFSTYRLSEVKHIDDHPSGEAIIDVYVYSRYHREFELATNIAVYFKDGEITKLTEDSIVYT